MELLLHPKANQLSVIETSLVSEEQEQEKEYASEIQMLKKECLSAPPQAIHAVIATFIQSLSQ